MEIDLQTLNSGGDNQAYGQVVAQRLDSFTSLIQHIDPARIAAVLHIRQWSVEEHLNRLLDIINQGRLDEDPRLELSAMRELDRLITRATGLIGATPGNQPHPIEIPVKAQVALLPDGTSPPNNLTSYLENKTNDQSPHQPPTPDYSAGNVGDDGRSTGGDRDSHPARAGSFHRPPTRTNP